MQFVHLLHYPGEADPAATVVANVIEDALKALRQGVVAHALLGIRACKLDPELPVDELKHLVGWSVFFAQAPGVLAGQATLVGCALEGRFLFTALFGLIECLEEEKPRKLFDVVSRINALSIELVASVFDDLLDFLAAMINPVFILVNLVAYGRSSERRDAP